MQDRGNQVLVMFAYKCYVLGMIGLVSSIEASGKDLFCLCMANYNINWGWITTDSKIYGTVEACNLNMVGVT